MKKVIGALKLITKTFCYPLFSLYFKICPFDIQVESLDETVDSLLSEQKSVIRFGDGEFKIISGGSISFQEYSSDLAQKLNEILLCEEPNLKVCLMDVFSNLKNQTFYAKLFWTFNLFFAQSTYRNLPKRKWGNSFISRPYLFYKDKTDKGVFFEKLSSLWANRNIVFVEGEQTRNGVGNDLYKNAKSIRRILCPSKNAYNKYKEIENLICDKIEKDSLLLFSLGPAAKPITFDLYKEGYQVLDIGHLDSEYEWFKLGAKKRIAIQGKHSAEMSDANIEICNDADYKKQVIGIITGDDYGK